MKPITPKLFVYVFAAFLSLSPFTVNAQTDNSVAPQEAKQIAIDAYIYGLSLIHI